MRFRFFGVPLVSVQAMFLVVSTTVTLVAACSDSTTSAPGADAATGPAPTTTGTTPLDAGAAPVSDATADTNTNDASSADFIGCRKLLADNPSLGSGVQTLDVDGPGPLPPIDVHCDMTFAGGGWTLIQSYDGTKTPADFAGPEADSGVLVAAPRPGMFGGLAGWVVKALAEKSTQVHIRRSFAADAAAADPDGGLWITSRAPNPGEISRPVSNLKDLVIVQKGTDGGFDDWTGPQAKALKLQWYPNVAGCDGLVPAERYPSVFWACGNYESLNIIKVQGGHCRWRWNDGAGVKEPLEVYIR